MVYSSPDSTRRNDMTTKLVAVTILLAGLLAAAGPGAIRARGAGAEKGGEPATVSGNGEAKVKQSPTLLRMYLQLVGRGKTLEEALTALKDRREAAVAKLETLKGKASSVTFSAPALNADSNSQRRRMELMVAQRMGRGKKAPKPVKPPVIVTTMLTADWPLEAGASEKLLLAAGTLRQQVKDADLGGTKESDKLSPEEQEMAEEMADQSNLAVAYGPETEQADPGQPQMLFVAKLADKDRQAATVEAFTKAKAQAAELAKAAGMHLGRLTSLGGGGAGGTMDWNQTDPYGNGVYTQYMQRMMSTGRMPGAQRDEAVAPAPDALEFDFTVTATFALEPIRDGE
jgi:uncharacterized protein YggE